MRFFAKVLSVVPFLLVTSVSIRAESPTKLGSEVIEKLAAYLNIDSDGPEMKKILYDYENRKALIAEESEIPPNKDAKVIKHLRGPKGIPLVASTQKEETAQTFSRSDVSEEHLKAQREAGQQMLNRYASVPELPTCKLSRRTETPTGYTDQREGKKVLLDMLFIRKEELPLDPEITFGERTTIYPFSRERPNFDAYAATGIGAPCLPFRLRITKEKIIREEGKNALKNYDKDPHGSGELHDLVTLTQNRLREEGKK